MPPKHKSCAVCQARKVKVSIEQAFTILHRPYASPTSATGKGPHARSASSVLGLARVILRQKNALTEEKVCGIAPCRIVCIEMSIFTYASMPVH
jgi:hypothetical protein